MAKRDTFRFFDLNFFRRDGTIVCDLSLFRIVRRIFIVISLKFGLIIGTFSNKNPCT